MNRKDLVKKISNETGYTQKDINAHLDALIDSIKDTLLDGEKVCISDFIRFEIVNVKERVGKVNVGVDKGKTWVSPAHKKVVIKTYPIFRDFIKCK